MWGWQVKGEHSGGRVFFCQELDRTEAGVRAWAVPRHYLPVRCGSHVWLGRRPAQLEGCYLLTPCKHWRRVMIALGSSSCSVTSGSYIQFKVILISKLRVAAGDEAGRHVCEVGSPRRQVPLDLHGRPRSWLTVLALHDWLAQL